MTGGLPTVCSPCIASRLCDLLTMNPLRLPLSAIAGIACGVTYVGQLARRSGRPVVAI